MTPPRLAAPLLAALLCACGSAAKTQGPSCFEPGPGWITFIHRVGTAFRVVAATEDGTCETPIAADAGGDVSPSWNTSTQRVAYLAAGTGLRVHDLGTGATTPVALPVGLTPGGVALSPDGRTLAFEGRAGTDQPDIYTVRVEGGTPTQLTTTTVSDSGPAWSPDGQLVYFVSARSGQYEVWSAHASDGSDPQQITSRSRILGAPAPSPDGLRIAYARRKPDQTSQVIEHVLAGGAERVLSDQHDGEPAYDTTGARVAVTTFRYAAGQADIVILDAASGALLKRVTSCGGTCGAPAFPR